MERKQRNRLYVVVVMMNEYVAAICFVNPANNID